MLDELFSEIEVVDVNHFDEVYQFVCYGKKSCAACTHYTNCSYSIHGRYIGTLRDERVFGMDVQLRV
ncbi:hypothetical protein EAT1b_2599 [Exiguobacterium sp. AT1b]|uniref:Uncharacterized protein n=1 Tax=Exiguobacterium sp. (strain ATCC BAA-1283 / AT1b) TaxID=360911 RepID=C4L4F2_EXISA|nr:hypothetical protein EAT1b_2599 [Exiguobacterium sp. AT1b]